MRGFRLASLTISSASDLHFSAIAVRRDLCDTTPRDGSFVDCTSNYDPRAERFCKINGYSLSLGASGLTLYGIFI